MALRPPGEGPAYRERILGMGSFGSGKSTAWLKIAEWAQKTKSDTQVYVMDSDASAERMLTGRGLDNVHVWNTVEWEDYTEATDLILGKARPQDWVVVDFMGTAWDAVQEWYVAQVYGKRDMGQFFMDARKAKGKGQQLDGWKDYSVINRVYRTWSNQLVHDNPAHTYLTAVADTLRETDDRGVKHLFSQFRVRPKGQKHMAFTVHTVLYFQTDGRGTFVLNSVKDRERELLVGEEFKDFVLDYLVKKAGWKP